MVSRGAQNGWKRSHARPCCGRERSRCLRLTILLAPIAGAASESPGQLPQQPAALIAEDSAWRGRIDLTSTVTIRGAAVRVAPGSTITFAPTERQPVRILLEGTPDRPAQLLFEGTADAPIVIATAPGEPPGAILHAAPAQPGFEPTAALVRARHVRFERLGRGMPSPLPQRMNEAAIGLQLAAAGAGLSLEMCEFNQCGPIVATPRSDDATLSVTNCRFADPVGDTALEILDGNATTCTLRSNALEGAVICHGGRLECAENVMVGPRVGLALEAGAAPGAAVTGNYIHNRRADDDEQFCFSSRLDDVRLERNVLIGGTWVVRRGTRTMRDNVLKGVAGLRHQQLEIETTTHQLIADLPPAAVIERNVLIGPAYSLVATGPGCRDAILRNNLFDGRGETGRGLHLNLLAREPVAAIITDNIFVGLTRAAVYDEASHPQAVARCTGNAIAEIGADAPFQFAGAESAGTPMVHDSRAALNLPRGEPPDWFGLEQELLAGELSVEDVRQRILACYPPSPAAGQSSKE